MFHLDLKVGALQPSSQSLLSDAVAGCIFDSVSCDCAMLCDDTLASLLPLSAHLLTEVLFLNLAHLQDSVGTWHMLAVLTLSAGSNLCMLDTSPVVAGVSTLWCQLNVVIQLAVNTSSVISVLCLTATTCLSMITKW
jgi:hypothetical protein